MPSNEAAVDIVRQIVWLRGSVQGVGFRDRIVAIAEGYDVSGTVRNIRPPEVLEIDVEGAADEIRRFIEDVLTHPPPLAAIMEMDRFDRPPRGLTSFRLGPTSSEMKIPE